MLKRIRKAPDEGRAYESQHGWLYISWGGYIYLLHLGLGRFTVTIEASKKTRNRYLASRRNK